MKLLTICMPALMLGAAALVTPALAQGDAPAAAASDNAAAAAPAQPAQDANSAATPAQPAQDAAPAQQNAAASTSGNTQMAMNSTGNAGDLSSIPDNQHKFSRAKKSSEDRSENQTTKQLNQQEASLNGGSSTASAQ
jgi:hypothetical protein